MVTTLANAIKRSRLAHAFLLTGVRGVGKTSTARLIAKALNCIGPDGEGGPQIDPCGVCEPCRAIAEGRHRPEERTLGKVRVSSCRCGWTASHKKNNKT